MNNSIQAPPGFVITLALIFILSGVLAVARVNDYLQIGYQCIVVGQLNVETRQIAQKLYWNPF